ncbi:LppM family (lipo)protein [Heliorestis convoluta]|uniref:LppM domain-containing protein n=1 Tax=Heliorestis convoluta TaxID=356322 RepID=A0A5Q2MZU5_9FIRM|nr:hypothetical protein [Heliorestis convoluta]QGG46756.1 hypothetical protein FTV88_0577 [Heliorestis convoluta]
MVKKSRLLSFFALLLLTTMVASACIEAKAHTTIYHDGSADVAYRVGYNQSLKAMMTASGEDPFAEIKKTAQEQGLIVRNYQDGSIIGIELTGHYKNLVEVPDPITFFRSFEENRDEGFVAEKGTLQIERNLWGTKYSVDESIDLRGMGAAIGFDEFGINASLLESMNFVLSFTFPEAPRSHNATSVTDEGKTLIWKLPAGEVTEIRFDLEMSHKGALAVIATSALLFIGTFFFFFRKRKNSKSQEDSRDNDSKDSEKSH